MIGDPNMEQDIFPISKLKMANMFRWVLRGCSGINQTCALISKMPHQSRVRRKEKEEREMVNKRNREGKREKYRENRDRNYNTK